MKRVIGNYAPIRPLGSGGMGSVWLASRCDGRFEGRAAIKLLNLALVDAQGIERFRQEGAVLAHLDHPNIARLLDSGVTDEGQPYLVLEYVEGETLDRYCDSHALDVRARVRLFLEVLAAVAHAHGRLVLHRDLKPANILVTPDGHVKLLDFGTAEIFDISATRSVVRVGAQEQALTLAYAAPEQIQGEEVSTATDVYALGVILYELLTGQHPTAGSGQAALGQVRAIIEAEPPRASEVAARNRRALRGDLDNILAMALRKSPAARFQTAVAFADDLRRYLNSHPIRARADSASYRLGKFLARNRIATAAAAIAFVSIAIAGVVSVQQKREANVQRDRALALSARNEAVIGFVNAMIAQSAPARGPISIQEMMERSYSKLSTRPIAPEHEAAVLALYAQFYANKGDGERAISMLTRSLQLTSTSADPALRAQLLCQRAYAESSLGQTDQARSDVEQGFRLAGEDDLAMVTCDETASWLAQATDEPDRALTFARRAQDRLRQSGIVKPDWDAVLLARVADSYAMRGRTVEADRYYADSLAGLAKIGRGESIATWAIRSRWAAIASETGDMLLALHNYEELLRIAAASSPNGKPPAWLLGSRGIVLAQLARYPEALATLDESLELARGSNSVLDMIIGSAARGEVCIALGDVATAARELHNLAPLIEEAHAADSVDMQRVLHLRARVETATDHPEQAIATYSQLLARSDVQRPMLARVLTERADLYIQLGSLDLAFADAQRAVQVARESQRDQPYSAYTGRALAALARCQQARAETSAARASAEQAAINLAKTLGVDHPDTQRARRTAQS